MPLGRQVSKACYTQRFFPDGGCTATRNLHWRSFVHISLNTGTLPSLPLRPLPLPPSSIPTNTRIQNPDAHFQAASRRVSSDCRWTCWLAGWLAGRTAVMQAVQRSLAQPASHQRAKPESHEQLELQPRCMVRASARCSYLRERRLDDQSALDAVDLRTIEQLRTLFSDQE